MTKYISDFIENENLSFKNILNPFFIFNILHKYRYTYYLLIGISGLLLNLVLSFIFSIYLFPNGLFDFKNTTVGIFIGLTINFIYNFILHILITFENKDNFWKKFIQFISYSLFVTYLIIIPVTVFLTDIFGDVLLNLGYLFLAKYIYLIITSFMVFLFSIINFLIFKLWMFK